mmetsp:Transcript_14240/g.20814  ORF Transcript_14240/g.20814 Transcript_14240/m.20814 type:complete len:201 (-) Transcript_14240:700-1302(-)
MCEEYGKKLNAIAIAQLAQELGFSSITSQALDTLQEVSVLLTKKLAYRAKLIAEHSGRTECNIVDTLQALSLLQLTPESIKQYMQSPSADLPFCRENIQFPYTPHLVPQEPKELTYTADNVPAFLPEFPPEHTYLFTKVPVTRDTDPSTVRAVRAKEKKLIEQRLAQLLSREETSQEETKEPSPFLKTSDAINHLIEDVD